MQFVAILGDKFLRVVRAVEIFSIRVFSRASVVAADNEVRCTIVFADDSVPERLSRARHAHCKREECEVRHAIRILGHDLLVDADTSEVVNITGLGEANNGVDEDICLVLACGTDSQLTVRTVHGIARLKCDNFPPCELFEVRAEFCRSVCRL